MTTTNKTGVSFTAKEVASIAEIKKEDVLRMDPENTLRRFRRTWLRGKRVHEDINNFWMGHAPDTMSDTYSRLDLELKLRLRKQGQLALVHRPTHSNCSNLLRDCGRSRMSNWRCNFSRIN